MPDLLLELFSEEIPARMQRKAAGDLKKLVTNGLVDNGLVYEAAREYWTPRRLTLDIRGLSARSKDVHEERKGPSVKAPEQAINGFLRSAGLSDISEAEVKTDPKKGDFYIARITKKGRSAEEIIADIMPDIIRSFPWPKSMRWGKQSTRQDALRWVRPLKNILCVFGPENDATEVVPFEVAGLKSNNITYGHRFLSDGKPIEVRRFDDYVTKLENAKVILDGDRRKEIILPMRAICVLPRGLIWSRMRDWPKKFQTLLNGLSCLWANSRKAFCKFLPKSSGSPSASIKNALSPANRGKSKNCPTTSYWYPILLLPMVAKK